MEILSRKIKKEDKTYTILEEIKKVYSYEQLFNELQDIQRQKLHLIEQSKMIKTNYDSLCEKEDELSKILDSDNNTFEEIDNA